MSKWIGQFITTDVRNHRIDDVFPQNLRARIEKLIELRGEIISPETLVESATQDVDFLFSTWGMPALDEETIKTQLPNLKAVFYGAESFTYRMRARGAGGDRTEAGTLKSVFYGYVPARDIRDKCRNIKR